MKNQPASYRGYRFPCEIISHAVWLYHRFGLSFRDVEDLLAERGVTVTYEAIRQWCRTFGLDYARRLRRRRGRMGDTWHLDELFAKLHGRQQYLWRAVDEDGDVIDILVQARRNRRAAIRFFREVVERAGLCPSTTDHRQAAQLPSGLPHRDAIRGPLHGPVHEQSGRSLPPTDPAAGAPDAPVQIRCPRATVSLGARTCSESLSCRPPPPAGRPSSTLADPGLRCLA